MKKRTPEVPDIPPSIDTAMGITLLEGQIAKAKELMSTPEDTAAHRAWNNTTREFLINTFGSRSHNIDAVIYASSSRSLRMNMPRHEWIEYQTSLIANQIKMLESCIEQLKTQIKIAAKNVPITRSEFVGNGTDIFIVHGHNSGIKEAVARTIQTLGLNPIVLHEQPNQGRTVIEKFTDHSNVGFAVVLLTSDDIAKANNLEELKPRARQNVILELGYFLGKLGRNKVCILYESGVEIPSDYSGVIYTPLDSDGKWKFDLAKELKAAGYAIDANKLFP